jgi:membrane protease YdiL (CAAX protease family)
MTDDKLKEKLFLVVKMVLWLQVLNSNVQLDLWLLVSGLSQLIVVMSFLPTVCCLWRHWCSKLIPFFLIFFLTAWGVLGVYVITQSDLSKCEHDSLWVMALVDLIFLFANVTVYYGSQIYGLNCCNRNRSENVELLSDFMVPTNAANAFEDDDEELGV